MKLNNHGLSLIELLVSIVLMGIVLTFLFDLLLNMENETENNNFAYNNQINRTEVIYTVGKDLNNYTLLGIEDKSADNNIIIDFHYIKGTGEEIAELKTEKKDDKYYIRYRNYDGEVTSWKMKDAEIDECANFEYYIDSVSDSYYFKLNLYLYNIPYHERNNKLWNNHLDDIEISYAGNKNNLDLTNGNFLTVNNEVSKKIGHCSEDDVD